MQISLEVVMTGLVYSTTVLLDHMVLQARVTPQFCSSAHINADA